MAIQFAVGAGTILRCDYSRGGFQAPEMVKARPVVVISPRLRHRDGLCTIVPFSETPPSHDVDYVIRLVMNEPLPAPYNAEVMWAKCDMLATVAFARLDLLRTERDRKENRRRYLHPKLSDEDFERVRNGVLAALGMSVKVVT